MRRTTYFVWTLALLIICAYVSSAQDFWQPTTGPYGGDIRSIAIDQNNRIFAATSGGGVFLSTDNGASWSAKNIGLPIYFVSCLAINPAGTVFAGTLASGVYRSTDHGETWQAVNVGLIDAEVRAIAIGSSYIFVGTNTLGVFRSSDNGTSWKQVGFSDAGEHIQTIAVSGTRNVLVGTDIGGVFRSTDNGDNWYSSSYGLTNLYVSSIAMLSPSTVCAATYGGGVFTSADSGKSWIAYNSGLTWWDVLSLATNASGNVFAGSNGRGVYRSTDKGKSWQNVSIGLDNGIIQTIAINSSGQMFAGTFGAGVYTSSNLGGNWTGANTGLMNTFIASLASNASGQIFAGSWGAGILRSIDNGDTWTAVNTSLTYTYVPSLVVNSSGHIFAGVAGDGVYRSTDNGLSWIQVNASLTELDVSTLTVGRNGYIYAGTSSGSVFRSMDNANTWSHVAVGSDVVFSLVTGPSGSLFAGTSGGGIFRSRDNGLTWDSTRSRITTADVQTMAIDSSGRVFAGTGGGGVFRSTDNGVSWSPTNTGLPGGANGYIQAIVVNPSGDLFAACGSDGVFRSTDNGSSWKSVSTGLPAVQPLSLAITPSGYLFAGMYGSGVYRTRSSTIRVTAPTVSTAAATAITSSTAILNATVNPSGALTTVHFEYGKSSTLANPDSTSSRAIGFGTSAVAFADSVKGLTPNMPYYFRVVAQNVVGRSSGSIQSFTTPNAPFPAPTLASPTNGSTGIPTSLTVSWNASAGAAWYQLQVSTSSAFSSTVVDKQGITSISYPVSGLLPSTTYYWRVNTTYTLGTSDWSSTWSFTTSNVATTGSLTVTVKNVDGTSTPLPGSNGQVQLYDSGNQPFGSPLATNAGGIAMFTSVPSGSGYSYQVFHNPVSIFGQEYWGSASGITITTSATTPSTFTRNQPYGTTLKIFNGTTDVTGQAVTIGTPLRIEFTIQNPNSGALDARARIVVDRDKAAPFDIDSTASSFRTIAGNNGTYVQQFTFTPKDQGDYYAVANVQILRASSGVTTDGWLWSSTKFFVVGSALAVPTLTFPADASTGISTSPTLTWITTSTATSYRLQVSITSDFATTVTDQTSLSNASYQVQGLANGTTYYWRVRATYASGTSNWSNVWSFTTIVAAPPAPSPSSPANSATGLSAPVTLTWLSIAGVASYHVQVSTNSSYTTPLVFEDTLVASNSRQVSNLAANTMYYWRVRGKNAAGFGAWSSSSTFTTAPTKAVTSPGVSFPANPSASTDYRLVSFPGTSSLSVAQVLSGTQNTDWRIFRDNGANEPNNLTELSSSSSLSPGEGYWLVSKGTFNFSNTVPMPQLNIDGTYTLNVRSGWNIIGNPFDLPVLWSVIKSDNGTTANLWTYSGTGGYQSSTTLDPFKGYYFSSSSTTLKIRYPFPSSSVASSSPSVIDWKLQLALETEGNSDSENYIGQAPSAKESLDDLDQLKPPRFLDQASLSLSMSAPNGGEQFMSSDFRPSASDGQVWNFSVANPKRSQGRIRIIGIENVPPGFDVVLIDAQNTVPIDLRAKSEVLLRNSSGKSTFSLIVGKRDFVQAKEDLLIPKEFELSQNYPNPFNPSTTITYKVPRESTVRLDILSLLGQRLETLAQGTHTPGTYSVVWTADRREASGVYFARLLVDGKVVKTQKMTLLK